MIWGRYVVVALILMVLASCRYRHIRVGSMCCPAAETQRVPCQAPPSKRIPTNRNIVTSLHWKVFADLHSYASCKGVDQKTRLRPFDLIPATVLKTQSYLYGFVEAVFTKESHNGKRSQPATQVQIHPWFIFSGSCVNCLSPKKKSDPLKLEAYFSANTQGILKHISIYTHSIYTHTRLCVYNI